MAKLTLTDLQGGYLAVAPYNANGALIEAAIENTLSRDGTTPNTMGANLDMNSNKVVNVTDGTNNQDSATVAQLNAAVVNSLATLDGVGNVTTTGVATGDLLYKSSGDWIDTAGLLSWDATKLLVTGTYAMVERASAPADVAGQGQLWVKTATPNQLWFTDDAGTDVQLGSGTADPLLLSDGSVSAPTYSFSGETDTGFYRISTDDIGVALGGVLEFRFSDKNNGTFQGEGGAGIRGTAATASAPNVHVNADDTDTGIGGGLDQITIVTGGQTAVDYTEVTSEVIQENSMDVGLTASVTQTQGQGALLSSYNEVGTVANASDTVTLPEAAAGRRCVVVNNGANDLQIFPASSDDLGAGVNTAETLSAGKSKFYLAHDATTWNPIAEATAGGATPPGVNGAKAYRSSATSALTSDVSTVVAFPQEAYDTNSFHDVSTNNSRMTIPAGVTRIKLSAYCRFSSFLAGGKRVIITKNGGAGSIDDAIAGANVPQQVIAGGVAQEAGVQVTSGVITVDTADYFEMEIESLGEASVTGEANNVWFELEVIA